MHSGMLNGDHSPAVCVYVSSRTARSGYHCHCAYLTVHSLAVLSCCFRLVLYSLAMLGTSGSSGFGSVSNEHIESSTFEMVSAGDQLSLRMSRQMPPLSLTL